MTQENPTTSREYLDVRDVAAMLGRHVVTIRRAIKRNELPAKKLNAGRFVISRRALDAYLAGER